METKKTAVQWLWMWIMQNPLGSFDDGVKAYNKAKAMEKEKHNKWNDFLEREKTIGISDAKTIERIQWYYNEYYNETYGK